MDYELTIKVICRVRVTAQSEDGAVVAAQEELSNMACVGDPQEAVDIDEMDVVRIKGLA